MPANPIPFSRLLRLALACILVFSFAGSLPAPVRAAGAISPFPAGAAPTTPFQQALAAALAARTAAGLPIPTVSITYALVPAATSGGAVRLAGTTTIAFASPAEAGYTRWPSFSVAAKLPPGARGTAAPGSYDAAIRAAVAAANPGAWDRYEYGREPRTYIVTETVIHSPAPAPNVPAPLATAAPAASGNLVLGFTVSGPDLDYSITGAWQILGVTVAEAEAAIALGWGAGLRLPFAAALTVPAAMAEGAQYTATTTLTGLDWSPADYAAAGLAPEDGSEFVLRYAFVVGAWAKILGAPVVEWSLADLRFDASRSFTTPFGSGATFPIPAFDLDPGATGLQWDIFSVLSVGVGFVVNPAVASDKLTAAWQAGTLSGTLTYTAPGAEVVFGPFPAAGFPTGAPPVVQLTDFRYWFTQFLVELGGYLQFDLFGYGTRSGTFSIAQLDLHDLTGGLYLGAHPGTPAALAATANRSPVCTAAVPTVARLWPVDNRLVPVAVTGIADPDDLAALTPTVTAISQDEPVDDPIAGPIDGQAPVPLGDYYGPDGSGLGTPTAWLRAQSDPGGNGRIYHVAYLAADGAGGSCSGSVTVGVPPPDAADAAPVDDGDLYDATAAGVRPLFIPLLRP